MKTKALSVVQWKTNYYSPDEIKPAYITRRHMASNGPHESLFAGVQLCKMQIIYVQGITKSRIEIVGRVHIEYMASH